MHSFTIACSKNAQVCHGFVMQWKGLSKEQNNIATKSVLRFCDYELIFDSITWNNR